MIKKKISLLLAFIMILGVLPLNILANTAKQELNNDKDYEQVVIDGKIFKVFTIGDLMDKNSIKRNDHKNFVRRNAPSIRIQREGGANTDIKFYLDLAWSTYDRPIINTKMDVYVGPPGKQGSIKLGYFNVDSEAQLTEAKRFEMVQEYDGTTPSIEFLVKNAFSQIRIAVPEDMRYDFILASAFWDEKNKYGNDVIFRIEGKQSVMHGYGIKWYDTDKTNRDKIEAKWTGKVGQEHNAILGTEDRNYSAYILNKLDDRYLKTYPDGTNYTEYPYYYDGKEIITFADKENEGKYTDVNLAINEKDDARTAGLTVDGKRDGSKVLKNNTKYLYHSVGDYRTFHMLSMREALEVKFNTGKGALTKGGEANQEIGTAQEIGHSEKIKDNESGRTITFPDGSKLIPPEKADGQTTENEFIGWNTDDKATSALTQGELDAIVFKEKTTTFYAIYKPADDYHVGVEYVDESKKAIKDIYRLKDETYPKSQSGSKDEEIKAEHKDKTKAPKFLGYEVTDVKVTPEATGQEKQVYTTDGKYTVEFIYKKLADIIPEKDDNGGNNPDATPEVKATYKKVTIKVDSEKGKFQKNNADVTGTEFVYYVNPVEGKSLQDVLTKSGLSAVALDENKAKIDDQNKWKFDPKQTEKTATDPATDFALATVIGKDNVKDTGVVMEVNFKQTKADQLKDKLDPVDIKVWVDETDTDGSKITWKNGVKLNDANKDNETLKGLLAEATVTDLGENGTIAQPATARNSSKQNLPDGKKGNLKVAFDDGSALVVENQTLYVSPLKVPVKPGEENQIDPDKLPKDKVAVKFLLGEGVKIGTKEGNATTPVLYQTIYVKPKTSLETSDIPATELQDKYKDNKWYNGNTELVAADYTNITAEKTFTAKAVLKGQGTVNVEYWANGVKIDDITEYKLPNKTYITSKSGAEDAEVKASEFTNDYFDLIGYEKDTTQGTNGIEVPADAKYLTSNPATVKFNYKKIDDIIGPVQPGDTKPAGYVTVTFKSDDESHKNNLRGKLWLQDATQTQAPTDESKLFTELVYYVNPKANTIDLNSNKLSGKDKDKQDINIVVNAEPENKYEILKKDGAYDWIKSDSSAIDGGKVTKDLTLTVQYDGLYSRRYVYESSKADMVLPAEIAQPIAPAKPEKLSKIPQTLKVPDMKLLVVKDGDKVKGVWYFDKWVRTVDETKQVVTFTGYWKYFEPIRNDITVQVGETPKAKDGIKNPKDAPKDTKYKFKDPIDTKTPGDKDATVIVTIKTPTKDDPNKTTEIEVPIVVHVTDLRCMTLAPEINPVYDSDEYITGRGIAGAVIEVRYRDYPILRTKVDTFGEWEVYTPYPLEDEQFVYARQIKEPCDPSVWVSEEIRYDDEYWRKDDKKEEPKKPVEIKKVWTPAELNARDHFSYIKGYGDNTFGPNRTITRAEVAMIFARLSINQSVSGAPQFTDVKPGDWYRRAVDIVARQGVVKGYEDGTFRPNQPITRREFAAIAARYAGNIDTWRTFRDVPSTDWAYTLINRVGGAGWITGYEDNTFRPNNLITRAEVVAIVNRMLNRKADKAYVDNNLMKSKHSFIDNLRSAWYFYDVHEAAVGHAFERQPNGVDEKWNRVTGQAFEIGKDVMYR